MSHVQGAVLAGLSAAASGGGQSAAARSAAGQLALAGISGSCMGAYLMWEFFPGEPQLQVEPLYQVPNSISKQSKITKSMQIIICCIS